MSTPRKPGNPDKLTLTPSASTRKTAQTPAGTTKADFSQVKSGVRSTEAAAPKVGADRAGAKQADFSKVQSSVASTEQTVGEQTYTVKRGDTLSHIAKAHYGRASRWKRIFEANRDQLDDPDRIQPGQVLKIPAADD